MLQYKRINNLHSEFNFMKKTKTLLTLFWVIICIASEFNFYKKQETLLTQFWVIIYITSEFNFYEKKNKKTETLLV